MKRARITKMKLDELAAVDSGAQAAAGTVVLKRKPDLGGAGKPAPLTAVQKRSALTTATLGHTHLVWGIDDSAAGTTSYESTYVDGGSNDCYSGHCHPWVRNADGSISIGESMGHTHAIGAMSAELAPTDANKSTHRAGPAQGGLTSKETITMPTEHETQIADLTKRNERLVRIEKMSGRHKSHLDTLSGEEADAFVAKSATERESIVAAALEADKPIWIGETTKVEVRKRDGELALQLAKQNEINAVKFAEAEKARETEVYKARAKTEVSNLPGTEAIKVRVLKALDREFTVEAEREEALRMFKATNEIAKSQLRSPGHGDGDAQEGDPLAEWNASVTKFAEKNGIKDLGAAEDKFLATTDGVVAKRKYDASRAYTPTR